MLEGGRNDELNVADTEPPRRMSGPGRIEIQGRILFIWIHGEEGFNDLCDDEINFDFSWYVHLR